MSEKDRIVIKENFEEVFKGTRFLKPEWSAGVAARRFCEGYIFDAFTAPTPLTVAHHMPQFYFSLPNKEGRAKLHPNNRDGVGFLRVYGLPGFRPDLLTSEERGEKLTAGIFSLLGDPALQDPEAGLKNVDDVPDIFDVVHRCNHDFPSLHLGFKKKVRIPGLSPAHYQFAKRHPFGEPVPVNDQIVVLKKEELHNSLSLRISGAALIFTSCIDREDILAPWEYKKSFQKGEPIILQPVKGPVTGHFNFFGQRQRFAFHNRNLPVEAFLSKEVLNVAFLNCLHLRYPALLNNVGPLQFD